MVLSEADHNVVHLVRPAEGGAPDRWHRHGCAVADAGNRPGRWFASPYGRRIQAALGGGVRIAHFPIATVVLAQAEGSTEADRAVQVSETLEPVHDQAPQAIPSSAAAALKKGIGRAKHIA